MQQHVDRPVLADRCERGRHLVGVGQIDLVPDGAAAALLDRSDRQVRGARALDPAQLALDELRRRAFAAGLAAAPPARA